MCSSQCLLTRPIVCVFKEMSLDQDNSLYVQRNVSWPLSLGCSLGLFVCSPSSPWSKNQSVYVSLCFIGNRKTGNFARMNGSKQLYVFPCCCLIKAFKQNFSSVNVLSHQPKFPINGNYNAIKVEVGISVDRLKLFSALGCDDKATAAKWKVICEGTAHH